MTPCDKCGELCRVLHDQAPELGRVVLAPPIRRDPLGQATEANQFRPLRFCGPCQKSKRFHRGSP